MEKVVTPLIEPAVKGFAAAPVVLKLERLKVDKTRNKSIAAIWMEKVVTPLIEPAVKGFAAAPVVLKLERLKVDKTRYE
nr:hypothetical protein [Tanacetum cinerariifolium]